MAHLRGFGWVGLSLAALLGWLLSATLHLVVSCDLLLTRPKVRTQISERGLRHRLRLYINLCLLATYLAGCCHMGLALGLQSHPCQEAYRHPAHARIPGFAHTRPMTKRLRPARLALRAPTLATQWLFFTMIFCRSRLCHWVTTLGAVALMLLTWHTSTGNQVTDLAFVEVQVDGTIWVPISVVSGILLAALSFHKFWTMPGPKSGGGRGYSFRCLKWLIPLLVVSSQLTSVSGVKVDASVAQHASGVSSTRNMGHLSLMHLAPQCGVNLESDHSRGHARAQPATRTASTVQGTMDHGRRRP